MTDKKMPKCIWLTESLGTTQWRTRMYRDDDTKYIRADLAPQSSVSKHLEEGEYQWIRLEDKECPWELAQAVYDPFISSDMLLDVDGKTYNFDDVAEFGPVIQPPPDQSN